MNMKHMNDMTNTELKTALGQSRSDAINYADGEMKAMQLLFAVCVILERIQYLVPTDHPEREMIDFHLGHFRAHMADGN